MNSSSRNRQLDILRGLAIALVLGRHLPDNGLSGTGALSGFFQVWQRIGWSGVDLFFVLSGFLVSGLLFKEFQNTGNVRVGRFFIRRGLRIYPAFYLMIAVSLLFSRGNMPPPDRILGELLFVQNYYNHMWLHTWTLAIEEHFYLLLGLLVFLMCRSGESRPFRLIPWIWLFSAVACLYWRIDTPYDTAKVLSPTHKRADSLFFGVLLSYFYLFYREPFAYWVRKLRWVLLALAALLLAPIFLIPLGTEPFMTRFGLTAAYLGFGALLAVFVVSENPDGGGLAGRVTAFFGVRSYSIYLWHLPVAYFIAQPLALAVGGGQAVLPAILFYILGTLAVGCASYQWVERPFLAWRDRRYPSR